uniref:Uncharacterized protein n=1 Tax=Brassica campestris TaxID=3711 RepID=M4CZE5_BRACM
MAVSSSSPAIIFAVTVLMLLTVSSVKLPFHPSGPAPALAQTTLLAASQLFQLRRGVERCLLLQEQGVADKAHSWTCMDIYVFVTPYRVTWDWYFISREHTMEFSEWEGKAEYEYVKQAERCFMEAGMVGTLRALWDVFPLFTNTGWGENSNIAFLEKHMGANFYAPPQPWGYKHYHRCNPLWRHASYSKIRGPWGGFETMEKWVSGAYAGHTAVCLRDSDGKLWVGESGNENEKRYCHGKSGGSLNKPRMMQIHILHCYRCILIIELSLMLQLRGNMLAAWMVNRMAITAWIFSWISGNYPPPLDAHLVASVMTVWSKMQPDYAANMWNEALNKRLGTEGLDLPDVLLEVEKRGSSFDELLAIKDAYMLKFFENNASRLPTWCNDNDDVKLPYCQILEKYRMELPDYNPMEPYPHMNDHCPSLPPKYHRPKNC